MDSVVFIGAIFFFLPIVLAVVSYIRWKNVQNDLVHVKARLVALESRDKPAAASAKNVSAEVPLPPHMTTAKGASPLAEAATMSPSPLSTSSEAELTAQPVTPYTDFVWEKKNVEQDTKKPRKAARSSAELEMLLGGKLLNRIGTIAVIIGSLFFLKYAFDNNWITEWGRICIGLVSAASLLVLAYRLKERDYTYVTQGLVGAAIPILYLSIYSAYQFYALVPQTIAYYSFLVVAAIAVWQSLIHRSLFVAQAAVIGALLTPYLASDGTSNNVLLSLHIFITLLAFFTLVELYKKWLSVALVAGIGGAMYMALMIIDANLGARADGVGLEPLVLVLFILITSLVIAFDYRRHVHPPVIGTVVRLYWTTPIYLVAVVAMNYNWESTSEFGLFALNILLICIPVAALIVNVRSKAPSQFSSSLYLVLAAVGAMGIVPASFHTFVVIGVGGLIVAVVCYISKVLDLASPPRFMLAFLSLYLVRFFTMDEAYWYVESDGYLAVLNLRVLALLSLAIASLSIAKYSDSIRVLTSSNRSLLFTSLAFFLVVFAIASDVHHLVYHTHYPDAHTDMDWTRLYYICLTAGIVAAAVSTSIALLFARIRKHQVLAQASYATMMLLTVIWLTNCVATLPSVLYSPLTSIRFLSGALLIVLLYFFTHRKGVRQLPVYAKGYGVATWLVFGLLTFVFVSAEAVWGFVVDWQSGDLLREQRQDAMNNFHLTLSLTWIAYATVVLIVGFVKRLQAARLTGLTILGLAILKIFFYDLSYLEQGRRIISFIILGGILLAASFFYQKFKSKILDSTDGGTPGKAANDDVPQSDNWI